MSQHSGVLRQVLHQRMRDKVPFLALAWRSAAIAVAALARFQPTTEVARTLALKIHRVTRDRTAQRIVEPIVRKVATSKPRIGKQTYKKLKFTPERVCLLKPFISPGEKGVLKIKFSEVIAELPGIPGFSKLTERYTLALEPSWTGAADFGLLQYADTASDVVVLTGEESDHDFLKSLGSALRPINIGPCDWGDHRLAEPYLNTPKRFDLIVNSSWAAWKRHFVIFQALSKLDRPIRVALIGFPWDGGTLDNVMNAAKFYGVADCLTVFENIPFEKVIELNCASRAAALLSLKEGSNRALSEAILCNTPVILLDRHLGGITKNVVRQTGLITSERDLPRSIQFILDNEASFSPRQWAMANNACTVSTDRLNTFLKELAAARNEPWTQDICVHSNSPECNRWDDPRSAILDAQTKEIAALFDN